jgi:GTPase SAR1 family protein
MSYRKVILLGNSGVGKTSILARFVEDTFMERKLSTVGVDFLTKIVKVHFNK